MADLFITKSFLLAFLQVFLGRMISYQKLDQKMLKKLLASFVSVNDALDYSEQKQILIPFRRKFLSEASEFSSAETNVDEAHNYFYFFNLLKNVMQVNWEEIFYRLPTVRLVDEFGVFTEFVSISEPEFLDAIRTVELEWLRRNLYNNAIDDLLLRLGNLQEISLSKHKNLVVLPNSIGDLKNLRCLNLSETSIIRLPETVSSLTDLQFLSLCLCKELVGLPMLPGRLISLELRGTNLQDMAVGEFDE